MNIAIILTCYNRKEKTKRCMETLHSQQMKHRDDYHFTVYVTDDGSTDGTKEMLRCYSESMDIVLLEGNNLFWNKGMHKAMQEAVKTPHDYYLMINDDVEFREDFLDVMIESFNESKMSCGISGATQDSQRTKTTYGGVSFNSKSFIAPSGTIKECNLANWNCFLIDQAVIDKIGIIDPHYVHSFGDYDYSMAMQRNGFKIYIAKDYVGICNRNTLKGTFKDKKLTRKQRINRFFSPKGMSFKSGIRYSIKNMDYLGLRGLLLFLGAYLRNLAVVLVG